MKLENLSALVGVDFSFDALFAVVDMSLKVDGIGKAVELVFVAKRVAEGDDAAAEFLADFFKKRIEIDAFLIHLINVDEGGDALFAELLPVLHGADLDADGGIDHEDRALDDAGDADGFGDEVIVARDVDDIDFVVVEVKRDDGRLGGAAALLLGGAVVADGVLLFNFAFFGNGLGDEGHGLDKTGLAAALVAQDGYITNVAGIINWHSGSISLIRL